MITYSPCNSPPPTYSSPTTEEKVCFFCRVPGHVASACADCTTCIECRANFHPYERCHFKESTCQKCGEVGHTEKIHNSKDEKLCIKLLVSNPTAFGHFASVRDRLDASLPAKLGNSSETKGRGKSSSHGSLMYESNRNSGPNNKYYPGSRGGFRVGRGRGARGSHN